MSSEQPLNAISMLEADHQQVKELFERLDSMTEAGATDEEKDALVAEIRNKLVVHESVENEVFFPAVRDALRRKDVLREAAQDQEDAGDAISALGDLKAGEPGYDRKLAKLRDKITAHAAEEEQDVFPAVAAANIDTEALGEKMAEKQDQFSQR